MNLGFKDQFVPMVEDGSKRHSIRAGFRWKEGMRADLYARPRQKGMRLLFRAMVVKVEQIEIEYTGTLVAPNTRLGAMIGGWSASDFTTITIEGVRLVADELDSFAWRDGFRPHPSEPTLTTDAFRDMVEFWYRMHGFGRKIRHFHGQVIHWDYERRFTKKLKNWSIAA